MARSANRPGEERRPARSDWSAPPEPSRDLVAAGVAAPVELPALPEGPGPRDRVEDLRPPGGAEWVPRVARVAIWALPAYALAYLWFTARPVPDPMADPVAWADQVTRGGYVGFQLVAGLGSALLGLVAVAALALLLAPTAARRLAGVGLLVALAGTGLQVFRQGVAGLAAPALGEQVQTGNLAAAYAYQQAYAPGGALAADGPLPPAGWALLAGSVFVTLSWLLLARAARRSGLFGRLDAVLLTMAAPLLGLASGLLPLLVPLGALLLLAAGLGIAWSGRRLGGDAVRAAAHPG